MSTIITFNDWLKKQPGNQENDQRLFLTEEEVKSFPQFKDATAEEIQNIIITLHGLALITYEVFCKELNVDRIAQAA